MEVGPVVEHNDKREMDVMSLKKKLVALAAAISLFVVPSVVSAMSRPLLNFAEVAAPS
jgi:hypothetical protein